MISFETLMKKKSEKKLQKKSIWYTKSTKIAFFEFLIGLISQNDILKYFYYKLNEL